MTLPAYDVAVPDFGDNLLRLRKRAGLTQQTLAERLGLKTPTPVVLWEGRRKALIPQPATIRKLAAALNCQPRDLLAGVETEYDKLRATSENVISVRPTPTPEKKSSRMTSADTPSGVKTMFPAHQEGGGHGDTAHIHPDRLSESESSIEAEIDAEHAETVLAWIRQLEQSVRDIRAVTDDLRRRARSQRHQKATAGAVRSRSKSDRAEGRRKRA